VTNHAEAGRPQAEAGRPQAEAPWSLDVAGHARALAEAVFGAETPLSLDTTTPMSLQESDTRLVALPQTFVLSGKHTNNHSGDTTMDDEGMTTPPPLTVGDVCPVETVDSDITDNRVLPCAHMKCTDVTFPLLKRCLNTGKCVADCATCVGFTVSAKEAAVCYSEAMFVSEVKLCKGTLNEAQQVMLMIQGGVGVIQSLVVMGVTRFRAISTPQVPFKLLVTEQVMRSNFVLMGLAGGSIALTRSSYMYRGYACETTHSHERYLARTQYASPIGYWLGFIFFILLLDTELQRRILIKNTQIEIKKCDYKMDRDFEHGHFHDRRGVTELKLWDNLYDRQQPSREFIDMSTKSFLFTYAAQTMYLFQFTNAVGILSAAVVLQEIVYRLINVAGSVYLGARTIVLPLAVVCMTLLFGASVYYAHKAITMTHADKLSAVYMAECGESVPDPDAVVHSSSQEDQDTRENLEEESSDDVDDDGPGETEVNDPNSVEYGAQSILSMMQIEAARTSTRRGYEKDWHVNTMKKIFAKTTAPVVTFRNDQNVVGAPNRTEWNDEKSRCKKWKLCMYPEGVPLPQDPTFPEDDPDSVLERFATCWMYANANPWPEQLFHVDVDPPKRFN